MDEFHKTGLHICGTFGKELKGNPITWMNFTRLVYIFAILLEG